MKKIEKCKSFIAIFLLAIMVVSMLSVESYAANTYDRDGYRVSSNKGYRSYTEGSGYDEKGNGLNIGVEAYLGTGPSRSVSRAADVKYGRGFISVYSGYTSAILTVIIIVMAVLILGYAKRINIDMFKYN